jgi:hypothetical protein
MNSRDAATSCEIIKYRNNNSKKSNEQRRGFILLFYELFLTIFLNVRDFIVSSFHTVVYFLRRDYHIPIASVLLSASPKFVGEFFAAAVELTANSDQENQSRNPHSIEGIIYGHWMFHKFVLKPLALLMTMWRFATASAQLILELVKESKLNFDSRVMNVLGKTPPIPARSKYEE